MNRKKWDEEDIKFKVKRKTTYGGVRRYVATFKGVVLGTGSSGHDARESAKSFISRWEDLEFQSEAVGAFVTEMKRGVERAQAISAADNYYDDWVESENAATAAANEEYYSS